MPIQGICVLTILQSSIPSIKGMRISVIRMSGFVSRIIGSAISPSGASPTSV